MGRFELADGATLFLDEIGELPLRLQSRLLRELQDGEYERLGSPHTRKVDVRVIAATNRDLEEAVKDGVFREDLFFRLNVIPIYLPPLRERREDIPLLANHYLQKLCEIHQRKITGIDSHTLKRLMEYNWPGNIRELQNVIEYAIHLAEDDIPIQNTHLPGKFNPDASKETTSDIAVSIEAYTRRTILALQEDHNEEAIAEILGISRKNLWEKRKRWQLERPISGK